MSLRSLCAALRTPSDRWVRYGFITGVGITDVFDTPNGRGWCVQASYCLTEISHDLVFPFDYDKRELEDVMYINNLNDIWYMVVNTSLIYNQNEPIASSSSGKYRAKRKAKKHKNRQYFEQTYE